MQKHEVVDLLVKKSLLKKIEYIAEHDGRSPNKEVELMMEEWVRAFEDAYGEIFIKHLGSMPE